MNNVIMLGRITKDPELKQTDSGKYFCRFILAVDRNRDQADFIPCICWGDAAQSFAKYVMQGRQLLIQGSMQSGQYKDMNGTIRYTLDLFAYKIQYLALPKGQGKGDLNGFTQVHDGGMPF